MKNLVALLSLFASISTLLCCALPALFVTLGFGAAFAGLVGTFPQLIWLSENKAGLFSVGAVLLAFGGFFQWRARFEPCPVDPALAKACTSARRNFLRLFVVTLALYLVGAFFAFAAPLFFA